MQLNGRVSRLYVTPLVRALAATFGRSDYLDYLESFRYPLAGEWALEVSVARSLRVPADWGLEIGVLSEIARSYPVNRICQVELADLYDHKHQDLSSEDSTAGLHRMSSDIAKAFFRKLAISGVVLTTESFRTLKAAYTREAYELIEHYDSDAAFNGFVYDRRQEEASVDLFGQAALQAGQDFLESPLESPFIPSWGRLEADLPGVGAALVAAVEHDQQNFR
jgi:glucosyl-3-phosphoglycerate synthase